MYGVPLDLPVNRFVGDALFQVCMGVDGVHFVFGHAGTIAVEGKWELFDSAGKMIDHSVEHEQRESYCLHVILNADVASARIDPPRSFSLAFSTGHRLVVYDENPGYESFHIYPDQIHV